MSLIAYGMNHKTAPMAIRERFSFSKPDIQHLLKDLKEQVGIKQAFLLSTCNRTELYTWAPPVRSLWDWLNHHPEIQFFHPKNCVEKQAWYRYGQSAGIRHLMRVASGLDSMALGEVEILGQLKSAFFLAKEAGLIGKHLQRLCEQVFCVAKAIRTHTKIGVNPISLAHLGAQLPGKIFSDLKTKTALLVGAGQTIRLCAKHLNRFGVSRFVIANRSQATALALGKGLLGQVDYIALSQIPNFLAQSDMLITATASPLPIIGKGLLERVVRVRQHQPLCIVDFALPRDVEPEASQLPQVHLYSLEDLNALAKENHTLRQSAINRAEDFIATAQKQFLDWIALQKSVPVIRQYRSHYEYIQKTMVELAKQELKLGLEASEVVKRLGKRLTNKFLHHPTVFLKQASIEKDLATLQTFSNIFDF